MINLFELRKERSQRGDLFQIIKGRTLWIRRCVYAFCMLPFNAHKSCF